MRVTRSENIFRMHSKLPPDEEALWSCLDDIPLPDSPSHTPRPCTPCVPVFYPDPGDEDLLRVGGKKLYTVCVGRIPGIYSSWESTQIQVKGFQGQDSKGCSTWSECVSYWQGLCRPGTHNHPSSAPSPLVVPLTPTRSPSHLASARGFSTPQKPRQSLAFQTPGTSPSPQVLWQMSTPSRTTATPSGLHSSSLPEGHPPASSPEQPQASTSTSSSSSRHTTAKKSGAELFVVINETKGDRVVYHDLAKAEARLAKLCSRGNECMLKITRRMKDTLRDSDDSDQ
ncbi:uncharacterized protein ARMOST_04146 [Armillaria ostoyae]|uniref:Ribonuclease H1 N-terminal domain-containing protein n=1 Tax=Armillaria ostoyae TaxID=47428 RepID=A0A284QWL5_ARMOS|nr:uncharacterized protein ARMOST_04146 [Armillaria ostoyae]